MPCLTSAAQQRHFLGWTNMAQILHDAWDAQVHMVHDTEAYDTLLDYYHTGEQQLQDLLDEYIRLKRLRKSFKRRQASPLPFLSLPSVIIHSLVPPALMTVIMCGVVHL